MRPEVVEHPGLVLELMREAATMGRPYSIAVLDMCMPDLDGLELARLISADLSLASTKLIMLTSTMQANGKDLHRLG